MPAKSLIPLYISKSLDELTKRAEEVHYKRCIPPDIPNEGQKADLSGDEERSYVLFFRYLQTFIRINNSVIYLKEKDFYPELFGTTKVEEVIDRLEQLKTSLKRRYSALIESHEIRAEESIDKKSMNPSINGYKQLDHNLYSSTNCQTIAKELENKTEMNRISILDTRTAEDFNELLSKRQLNSAFDYELTELKTEPKKVDKSIVNCLSEESVVKSRLAEIFKPRPSKAPVPGTAYLVSNMPSILDRSTKPMIEEKISVETMDETKVDIEEAIEEDPSESQLGYPLRISAKVALGIFWDIENCPVPLTKSASSVAKCLRDFIRAGNPECGYAKEFFCVCDIRKMDERIQEGLRNNGVVVVHVNGTAKNAADDELQKLIDKYVDNYGANESAVLCIITGDINFAIPVHNALRKDLKVILIHGRNCSADLKNLVNESYLYEDIIKCADNVSKLDNQLKPVYLEVSNLPTHESSALVLGRLANLSANCGGRPQTLSNGKAFIRFGCKGDAQRCQQRMDGEDVFGHKIQVKLSDGDPKTIPQTTRTLAKSQTDSTQILKQSQDGDDCRSIIIGLTFKKGTDLIKLVQDMIIKWNDKKLTPDLIKYVQGGKLNQENGKLVHKLHVLAISPEANKLLVFRSKKYLKDSGIKWYFTYQKKNEVLKGENRVKHVISAVKKAYLLLAIDCVSVIKGLETKKDDNVAKMVRKIVYSWNDKSVQPNYVKTVERDPKFAHKDGVILLFVTAWSAENSNALLAAANRHLKPKDGFQWNAYQRKRNTSKDTDTESNISDGLEVIPSPEAPTVHLSDIPVTNDKRSVITGLETTKDSNSKQLAKDVRNLINNWRELKINGNMIQMVDRFPGFSASNGKIPLLVTAVNTKASVALLSAAKHYLHPSGGIFWETYSHFKADPSFQVSQPKSGLGSSSAALPPSYQNSLKSTSQLEETPVLVKQESVVNDAIVQPVPAQDLVSSQTKFYGPPLNGYPFPVSHSTNIPPINEQNFVRSDSTQNTNSVETPDYQSLLNPKLVTELVSPDPPVPDLRKADNNLFKSLVSGFGSLFKSSKFSSEKTVSKPFLDFYSPVSFKKSFPEGMTEGFTLYIRGELNSSADCFAINFIVNDFDIAFQFNVRLTHSLVLRNSCSAFQGWGQGEGEALNFPFTVGQPFDIIIQVKRTKYVVIVNGQHFCDYEHRMPFNSVKGLSIAGVLTIESVCTS